MGAISIKEIQKKFDSRGYLLLTFERKKDSKLRFYCRECGNIGLIRLNKFNYGQGCAICGRKIAAQKTSLTRAKNRKEPYSIYSIYCDCGNEKRTKYKKCCDVCKLKSGNKRVYYSLNGIKYLAEQAGCEVLSTSYTPGQIIDFKCKCGNLFSKTIVSFNHRGSHCRDCSIKLKTGENNPNWNPNLTDEHREINKKREWGIQREYIKWRKSVYMRDNHKCIICGGGSGKLNAHHFYNKSHHKNIAYDINNGVTICKTHHIEFHSKYGNKNNTIIQFNEFYKIYTNTEFPNYMNLAQYLESKIHEVIYV